MSEPSTSVTYTSSINKSDKEKKYEQEKYKKIIQRQQLSLIKSRRIMKALRNTVAIKALEIQALKRKINSDKYKKALSSVFTEDEIFLKLEQIFQYYSKDFNNIKNTNLKLFLIKKCKNIKAEHILFCHTFVT